jgi:hypothetical protein
VLFLLSGEKAVEYSEKLLLFQKSLFFDSIPYAMMTEISQSTNTVNGHFLPAPQGLTCFYNDDLSKVFVDKDIATTFNTLLRTGVYSLERVRAFARKTFFDPLIEGAFDSACARVEQFAGRTATAFNR